MLTIAAVLGGLLFIFSYLRFVLSGFRYHPITGLLAVIPVVNLITIPTLMDTKLLRTIIIGIIGLILSVSAWFLGADKSLQKHIATLRGQPTIVSSKTQALVEKKNKTAPQDKSSENKKASASTTKIEAEIKDTLTQEHQEAPQAVYFEILPKKALYSMKFVDIPVQKIDTLIGRIVRITKADGATIEGQIQNIEKGSVFISKNSEGNIAYEMLIGNIKQLLVMVRREK